MGKDVYTCSIFEYDVSSGFRFRVICLGFQLQSNTCLAYSLYAIGQHRNTAELRSRFYLGSQLLDKDEQRVVWAGDHGLANAREGLGFEWGERDPVKA